MFKAKDLFTIGLRLGRQNPAFALCDNPACEACVKQRAAISRDRFQREAFRITASARLAGKYIPEIIDNLKAAGIGAVELDYLQGKACARMSAEKLTAAVQELTAAGIAVSALRLQYIPEATEPLLKLAAAAGIDRVILPLCHPAPTPLTWRSRTAFASPLPTAAKPVSSQPETMPPLR